MVLPGSGGQSKNFPFYSQYFHTHITIHSHTESPVLQLSDGNDKVRAIPEKRCVLILREIPEETPKEVECVFCL